MPHAGKNGERARTQAEACATWGALTAWNAVICAEGGGASYSEIAPESFRVEPSGAYLNHGHPACEPQQTRSF
jgi:hypothetical protein